MGTWSVGLDGIGGEEAPERGVQIACTQVPHARLLGIVLAAETKAAGHAALGAVIAKRGVIGRANRCTTAVDDRAHRAQAVAQQIIACAGWINLRQWPRTVDVALAAVVNDMNFLVCFFVVFYFMIGGTCIGYQPWFEY